MFGFFKILIVVSNSPVQWEASGSGTVDSMIPMTAGKRERVVPNTKNTETACTQISLNMVQYGGVTSTKATFREALTAIEEWGEGERDHKIDLETSTTTYHLAALLSDFSRLSSPSDDEQKAACSAYQHMRYHGNTHVHQCPTHQHMRCDYCI